MLLKLVLRSWSVPGIEEFPNIEAIQNYMAAFNELNSVPILREYECVGD